MAEENKKRKLTRDIVLIYEDDKAAFIEIKKETGFSVRELYRQAFAMFLKSRRKK